MWKWILSHKKVICVLSIVFLIGVPIMVYGLSVIPVFPVGGNNDWAGFWGGYLGAIVGVMGAIGVMLYSSKIDKKMHIREEKREFYDKLISDKVEMNASFKKILKDVYYKNNEDEVIHIKDERSFLEQCIQYNQAVDKCKIHLLIAQNSGYYIGIESVVKIIDDSLKEWDSIIKMIEKERISSEEKKKFFIDLKMSYWCMEAMDSEINKFIQMNIIVDNKDS